MRLAAVLAASALLLAACDSGGASSTPAASPTASDSVPGGYLRIPGGDAIPGAIGTRCWQSKCVDVMGVVTNEDAESLKPGDAVAFSFEAGVPPTLQISWFAATAPPPTANQGVRQWDNLPMSEPVATGTQAPANPGRYVVMVFGQWPGQGDVTYGFFVDVEP